MSKGQDRGQLDWLVELVGASAPAAAAAFAAARLSPASGWPVATAVLAGGGGMFIAAFAAMRLVPAEERHLALSQFEAPLDLEDVLLLDEPFGPLDELLLDQPFAEPVAPVELVVAATEAVAELLLDDPLPATAADSRVVQLFADGRMPTAGQLKQSIDRHLADGARPPPASDSSDALSDALAALRRSLRQA